MEYYGLELKPTEFYTNPTTPEQENCFTYLKTAGQCIRAKVLIWDGFLI